MTNSAIVPRLSSRQWWSGAKPGSTSAVGRFFVVTYVVAYAMWALVALAAGDVLALPMVLLAVLFLLMLPLILIMKRPEHAHGAGAMGH